MAVKKIHIPDIGTVNLHKRRGVKGMRLSITSRGQVRVSLPYWVPFGVAAEFAAGKKEWIKSQLSPPGHLMHGGRVGKAHRVIFVADTARRTVATRITGSEIRIHHPADLATENEQVQRAARNASVRALKTQAEKLLPQRLDTLARENNFTYEKVVIKQLTSRWGSCSNSRHIALSCFLMQLPWHLIDYVLLHELLHTRVLAHGPAFWNELEQYVPNLKAVRKDIKSYRPVLLAH